MINRADGEWLSAAPSVSMERFGGILFCIKDGSRMKSSNTDIFIMYHFHYELL